MVKQICMIFYKWKGCSAGWGLYDHILDFSSSFKFQERFFKKKTQSYGYTQGTCQSALRMVYNT